MVISDTRGQQSNIFKDKICLIQLNIVDGHFFCSGIQNTLARCCPD